jgi:hypothetical protein
VGDHPVKVPTELVEQWWEEVVDARSDHWPTDVANKAAQWGADQELEACCKDMNTWGGVTSYGRVLADELRAARRPKSPSLKQQALAALEPIERSAAAPVPTNKESLLLIRRALETLDA